ncbi:MAG: hypothetical protein CFH43_00372 [Proteobacteria bacterium]|nr:MAG: hypothetical protein CFH43_00372 [Pseudomonadota bacterium]
MATAKEYAKQLQQLLPLGPAWEVGSDTTRESFIEAIGEILAITHNRAENLVNESNPHFTIELLKEWEIDAGLPDKCVPTNQTLSERRAALVAKLLRKGSQTRQYYIDVATALGYSITIDEFDVFRVDSEAGQELTEEDVVYLWRINAPEETVRTFNMQSACSEPLGKWGNELLECVLNRIKPAHTRLLFGYSNN